MSAPVENLENKAEEGLDEAQQTAQDTVKDVTDKAEEAVKKVDPAHNSGGSG